MARAGHIQGRAQRTRRRRSGIQIQPPQPLPDLLPCDTIRIRHPRLRAQELQAAKQHRHAAAAMRDYPVDVREAAEGGRVEHVDYRARGLECDFDERRGPALRGRGVGVGVHEDRRGEFVKLRPYRIEAGVAEGDAVIYASDGEAVCMQLACRAGDFFESRGGIVGWQGGEEAEARGVLRDEGGAVVVGGFEGGERWRDVAEHLHCYAGFVEVGERAFGGPFEGRWEHESAVAQRVPAGFELLWRLRGREVPVDVNPSCSHDQRWRAIVAVEVLEPRSWLHSQGS